MVPQALLRVELAEAPVAGISASLPLGTDAVDLLPVLRQLAEGGEGLAADLNHIVGVASFPDGLGSMQLFWMGASVYCHQVVSSVVTFLFNA